MAKSKRIAVVTGGAGFLGSHLCDRLIEKDFRVYCVDNLITGNKSNISHFLKDKNFRFIRHDVSEHLDIKGKIHYVLHFASPASPVDYLAYPIQTMKVGALGTHNMLGLARAKKAKFLLASTSEVYGDPKEHPQKESYWGHVNPVGPRGVYDEAKRFAEAITLAYHRQHKIDTKIVRIFNTYGPRMRIMDGRVVPNFIYQAIHGKPLTVYGNGRQTRSFCYYTDMVDGIIKLLLAELSGPVNIGNPKEFTVMELARLLIKLTGSRSRVVYKPLPEDDPKQRKPDITLARTKLKWFPRVQLKEGLKETYRWFKEREKRQPLF